MQLFVPWARVGGAHLNLVCLCSTEGLWHCPPLPWAALPRETRFSRHRDSAPNCSALSEDFSLAFAKSLLSADQEMSCGETGVRLKSLWPTMTTRGSAGVCLSSSGPQPLVRAQNPRAAQWLQKSAVPSPSFAVFWNLTPCPGCSDCSLMSPDRFRFVYLAFFLLGRVGFLLQATLNSLEAHVPRLLFLKV